MEMICPRCGASSEKKEFAGNFCEGCSKIAVKCPDKVRLPQCPVCKKLGKHKTVEAAVIAQVRGDFVSAKYDEKTCVLAVLYQKDGKIVERKKVVEAGYKKEICADCNKRAGSYFEAIVQIRGQKEGMPRAYKLISEKLERLTFISKVVELHEGVDLYTGDRKMTAQAISEAGYKADSRSEKLAGERDGKRLYRSTFCIRL